MARTPQPARETRDKADREQAKITILTRDSFLRSQGPAAIPVLLPVLNATVLIRRIDLLSMSRSGTAYFPFRNAINQMIAEGGVAKEKLTATTIADTLDLAAVVALDTVVITPPHLVEPLAEAIALDEAEVAGDIEAWERELEKASKAQDFARTAALSVAKPQARWTHRIRVLSEIKARDLRPLFVAPGEQPDPDQLVLSYPFPTGDPADEATWQHDFEGDGGIPAADLIVILRNAHKWGPGAMGPQFRGDQA